MQRHNHKTRIDRPRSRGAIATAILASLVGMHPLASYSTAEPDLGVLENYREVSDEELAQMRGRFVGSGLPVFFGIYMTTQWDGKSAGLNVAFDFTGSLQTDDAVQIGMQFLENGVEQEPSYIPPDSVISIDIGGLETTRGVAQAVRVLGSGNSAYNAADILVGVDDLAGTAPAGVLTIAESDDSSQAATFSDGSIATALVTEEGIGVEIVVPGGSAARQLIRVGDGTGSGLFQTIQLQGSDTAVLNTLELSALFGPAGGTAPGGSTLGLREALESVRHLPGN